MPAPPLDAWLSDPQVRSHHRRRAAADPAALWSAAQALRLSDTRSLGRLVRWRIPGTPRDLPFGELLRRYPFTLLEEDDAHSISGLCGRIWTLARDYPRLDGAEAFRAWDERATVRVLFGNWVEETGDGGSALVTEARVAAVDRVGALRLRALWVVVGRFERVIGAEPLPLAVRRAERVS